VLCDFGGSSIDGSNILEFPKPRYARPQLRKGGKPDVKDDIFALGTTLYEISTGRMPYKENSDDEVASLFRSQTYPNLQEVLPHGLGDIIGKCWSERYTFAEQIIHDLRKVLLIFTVALLIFRRLNSLSGARILFALNQVITNDFSLWNFGSLYSSRNLEERLATLKSRSKHLCLPYADILRTSMYLGLETAFWMLAFNFRNMIRNLLLERWW
jgi:serine/threonine protein kinase